MKYKPLDKVRIKSLDWYNENKDEYDYIDFGKHMFYPLMSKYCGKVFTIDYVYSDFYTMNNNDYEWTDEMIEGLVEEEVDLIPKFGEYSDNEPLDVPTMTTDFVKEYGLPCPNGYIFKDENGNVINTHKIVLEKKKKEYPKTYKECCEIVGDALKWDNPFRINRDTHPYIKHLDNLIERFCKLLICREAYWRIAGEEMGLGKPWEPDWDTNENELFVIANYNGTIVKTGWYYVYTKILAFPTKEMRDAFYKNFKELINCCKELL